MQTTVASRVYGTILANPGVTSRELKKLLPNANAGAINTALVHFCANNAVKAKTVAGKPRSTRYYKGTAPVVLRNAAQTTTSKATLVMDVKQAIAQMQQLLTKLEAAA